MTARNRRDCWSAATRDKAKKTIPRTRREREVIQNHRGGGSVGKRVFRREGAIGTGEERTAQATYGTSVIQSPFGSHATRHRSAESRRWGVPSFAYHVASVRIGKGHRTAELPCPEADAFVASCAMRNSAFPALL